MPVYYIDGQSQGNEQNSLPRKAKIAIAYAESDMIDHGKFRVYWQPIGDRTNNEAEYYALLKALELIAEKTTGKVPGNMGEALVEDEKLTELSSNARDLIKKIGPVRLEWVPRDQNYAGLWLEGKMKPFSVERLRE